MSLKERALSGRAGSRAVRGSSSRKAEDQAEARAEEFDPGLLDLYTRTTYSVRSKNGRQIFFSLKSAERLKSLKGRKFSIITAWNPMNRPLGKCANQSRNRQLKKELTRAGYHFYPSMGSLDEHAEESFTVENMNEEEALRFGARFAQYAVLVADEKGCRLVRCPPKV